MKRIEYSLDGVLLSYINEPSDREIMIHSSVKAGDYVRALDEIGRGYHVDAEAPRKGGVVDCVQYLHDEKRGLTLSIELRTIRNYR